jgi:hypothetical protein
VRGGRGQCCSGILITKKKGEDMEFNSRWDQKRNNILGAKNKRGGGGDLSKNEALLRVIWCNHTNFIGC